MVFGEVARRYLSSGRENRMNVSAAIVYSVNSGRSLLDAFVVAQNVLRTLLYDDRFSVFFDGKAGPASARRQDDARGCERKNEVEACEANLIHGVLLKSLSSGSASSFKD